MDWKRKVIIEGREMCHLRNYEGLKLIAMGLEKRGLEIRLYLEDKEKGGL